MSDSDGCAEPVAAVIVLVLCVLLAIYEIVLLRDIRSELQNVNVHLQQQADAQKAVVKEEKK